MVYTGFEWIWFLLGIGFLGIVLFATFAVIMILRFYSLLKDIMDWEKSQNTIGESTHEMT